MDLWWSQKDEIGKDTSLTDFCQRKEGEMLGGFLVESIGRNRWYGYKLDRVIFPGGSSKKTRYKHENQ
ncbi:hypothetical protein G9P44_004425 [Scheffersomyces stipitis]|nr:hypothetical protein G9P44_004425 [Scheffersomyces stipitis]